MRARSLNCGEVLRALNTKLDPKGESGRGNDLGEGKNFRDWIIRRESLQRSYDRHTKPSTT